MLTRIASIYFAPVSADRPKFQAQYQIPAVPKGAEPAVIQVEDKIQREEGTYSGSQIPGKRQKLIYRILGEDIAKDIVAQWTQYGVGMHPQCHPGIWIIRERIPLLHENGSAQVDAEGVPQWREATADEQNKMWKEDLENAKRCDAAYAEYLILKGDAVDRMEDGDPRKFPGVTESMKLAARQYGIERKWLETLTSADSKLCPYCASVISSKVIKCPHCQSVVDIQRYAQLQAAEAAAVRQATSTAPQSPKTSPPPKTTQEHYAQQVSGGS
jgi:hypothetical protein